MSSLPFISHHLFVAATSQDSHARGIPARQELPPPGPADSVDTVLLALRERCEPAFAQRADSLRRAILLAET
ncbi:MAG TPA: hypothetical protein VNZ64_27455 [Candidatus Acidoferrum sp.]|jgi:hypothetical protein|nr:hypothetical protein [Candidatus Acidoferrum sp.]